MINRRNFLAGLAAVGISAPYVVRNSGLLMPVKSRSAILQNLQDLSPVEFLLAQDLAAYGYCYSYHTKSGIVRIPPSEWF